MALSVDEILYKIKDSIKIDCLKSIYNHRCLTVEQIYQLHFSSSNDENKEKNIKESKDAMRELIKLGVVEKEDHFKGEHYFLTTIGINVLRKAFDLPSNIYDPKKRVVRRGYHRAGELRISNRYINHQHSLNQFMIDFKMLEHDIHWKYYDEKHISSFTGIRPDGLLNVMDLDFFIEIDMNTESSKQLYDKWENYRRFLQSREYAFSERKVVVLFVIENTKNPQTRINLVKHTIEARIMDMIDSKFEIYIDTKENLINIIDKKIKMMKAMIPRETDEAFKVLAGHGFSVAYGSLISKYTGNVEYDLYARKIDENNNIIEEDGKLQEYVVDSYLDSPYSVLKKIAYLNNTNGYFKDYFGRELTYLIIVDDLEVMFKDLQLLDLVGIQNVFFTTIERLESKEHYKNAFIQFDGFGNIFSFKDAGFKYRQEEGEMEMN